MGQANHSKGFRGIKISGVNGIAIMLLMTAIDPSFRKRSTLDKFISNFVEYMKDFNSTKFEIKNNLGYI